MKNLLYKIAVLIAIIIFISSCEDVIDVDLPENEPRLVIDALIRVDTTQPTTLVQVKVSETSAFFDATAPASLQQITMSNLDNPGGDNQVLNEEIPGSGIYSESFPTEELIRDRWFLQLDFEDRFFVAEAKFNPSVPIDNLRFGDGGGFSGDDTELIISYTDNGEREDFYLFDFDFGNFFPSEDEFYNGQAFEFSYFYDDEFDPGTELEISILGIDQEFFNYMDLLIEQSEGGFGPFETPSLTVRGNFINATNIDNDNNFDNVDDPNNYALGYFAIVQEFKETIVVEE